MVKEGSLLKKVLSFLFKNKFSQKDSYEPDNGVSDDNVPPEGADISSSEKLLMGNVLCLRDLTAEDIMIPRVEISAVKKDISFFDLVKTFSNSPRLQLLVYGSSLDDIVGIISIRDVLPFCFKPETFDVTSVMRNVSFVVPSMKLDELLEQMKTTGMHLAIVIDEFGGVDGLVTLEDVVSKILGGIYQIDTPASVPHLVKQQDGSYVMDAKLLIEDAEKTLSKKLLLPIGDEEDAPDVETIGGLVVALANRVPAKGEVFTHPSGIKFEVVDSDLRRVRRVVARMDSAVVG